MGNGSVETRLQWRQSILIFKKCHLLDLGLCTDEHFSSKIVVNDNHSQLAV
jgi:hypothetical protein